MDDMVNTVQDAIQADAEHLQQKMVHMLHDAEKKVQAKKTFFMRKLRQSEYNKGNFAKKPAQKIQSLQEKLYQDLSKTVRNITQSISEVQILIDNFLEQLSLTTFQQNIDQEQVQTEVSKVMLLVSEFAQDMILKSGQMEKDVGETIQEGFSFLQLIISQQRFHSNEQEYVWYKQQEGVSDEEDMSELSDGEDVSEQSELQKKQVELKEAKVSIEHLDVQDVCIAQSSEKKTKEQREVPKLGFDIVVSGNEQDDQGAIAGCKNEQDDEQDQETLEAIKRRVDFPSPGSRKVPSR